MASHRKNSELFFEQAVVGYFQNELPSEPGRFEYMPYRGHGHYRLGEALKAGPQRCYYIVEGEKRYFTVLSVANHRLQISHFE